MKVTLNVIDQKLSDLICEVKEVKEHVKITNGKVADAHLKIESLRVQEENCPAKNNYKEDKLNTRSWIMWLPSLISTGIAVVVFLKVR